MIGREVIIDDVPVWTPSREELLGAIADQLSRPPASARPVRLFTLNPEIMMLARRDASYRRTLAKAEWNVVDGVGLALAIRWRARTVAERHPGADLVLELAAAAQHACRPVLIVGGTPSRLEQACQRLRSLFPCLVVEGISPPYDPSEVAGAEIEIGAALARLRPGVVLVCLGAPKQERWAELWLNRLALADVRIVAGLGGTVDFLSGDVKRAPAIVRRMGGEWMFRLTVEPWRWKRQLSTLPAFAMRMLLSRRAVGASREPHAQAAPMHRGSSPRVVLYAHYMPPHPSASATRMMSLARYLREGGCEVVLLTTVRGPAEFEGFRIARPAGRVGLATWLARNPRCPILVSSPPATPAAEVATIARWLGYRVVVDVRDPYVSEALSTGALRPGPKAWLKRHLERKLLEAGHETSIVSQPLLESMRRLMRLELCRAVVAPNGVDTELFARDARARVELRCAHGIGDDSPVFVYSGILGGKELDKVLEALAGPLRRGAYLFVLAVVDEHSRPLLDELERRTHELGIEDRVAWVQNVPLREVPRYLSAADIGINPLPLSRTYCLPVKTFEYLACGAHNLAFGSAQGALAGILADPRAGNIVSTWDAFAETAGHLCSGIAAVRAGVVARCDLAKAYDRNLANGVLRRLLLGGDAAVQDGTDAAA